MEKNPYNFEEFWRMFLTDKKGCPKLQCIVSYTHILMEDAKVLNVHVYQLSNFEH